MIIRKAELRDLKELLEIYNYEVVNGTATFDAVPQTGEERLRWFEEHNRENHPLYVADVDGVVAGYVSLSEFRTKSAYFETVELSIYVARDFRRQGVASVLMEFIIDLAKKDDTIHTIVSVITGGNDVSVRLHEKFGFNYCGSLVEVGHKHGQYIGVMYYQLMV
ncbi:MAG: N-acetyltransferase [Oscillospiraceae bacterium]|nr:N-acetyltransferase [Oscillospiraceae bacterium]